MLALASAILAGCDDPRLKAVFQAAPAEGFRVATRWPRAQRSGLARDFAAWLRDHPAEEVDAGAVAWIEVPDSGSIVDALHTRDGVPDVLLGGPAWDYARLAAEDRLESLGEGAPRPYWLVARSTPVGLSAGASRGARLALADPREDPATLAWAVGIAGEDPGGWRVGYAGLMDLYGAASVEVGWRGSSARAAVDRGRADVTVGPLESSPFLLEEGAGIPRGAARPKAGRAFLKFLTEAKGGRMGPKFEGATAAGATADAAGLAADLLGATLVDAREELSTAVAAVRAAGSPAWAVERLTQPPPWPPASIEKLLAKKGEAGLALVETLMGQIAPDPGLRDWLARSWLRPRRDFDRAVLAEVAAVERGRLAREPRFRAWLRAEWTQWARQRYRWVARLAAASPRPSPPPATDES